jgi:hypothetical protein
VRLCKYAKQPDDYMGDNFPHFERHPITSSPAPATMSNMKAKQSGTKERRSRALIVEGPELRSGLHGEL